MVKGLLILALMGTLGGPTIATAPERPFRFKGKVSDLQRPPDLAPRDWKGPVGLVLDDIRDFSSLEPKQRSTARELTSDFVVRGATASGEFNFWQGGEFSIARNLVAVRIVVFRTSRAANAAFKDFFLSDKPLQLVEGIGDRAVSDKSGGFGAVLLGNCMLSCRVVGKSHRSGDILKHYLAELQRQGAIQRLAVTPREKNGLQPETASTARLTGHTDAVYDLAFSPDGKYLASASCDFTVALWDLTRRKEIRTWETRYQVLSVAFSPAGKLLASGGGELLLWRMSDGRQLFRFQHAPERVIHSMEFSPDGGALVTAASGRERDGWASEVVFWQVAPAFRMRLKKHFDVQVTSVAFSPDGKTVAVALRGVAGQPSEVLLLDSRTGRPNASAKEFGPHDLSLAFSPHGKTLGIKAYDLYLWDVPTQTVRVRIKTNDPEPHPWDPAFSPDGRNVACAGSGRLFSARLGVVRLWDTSTGQLRRSFVSWPVSTHRGLARPHRPVPMAVAFSPDGKTLAIGEGQFHVFGFIRLRSVKDLGAGEDGTDDESEAH